MRISMGAPQRSHERCKALEDFAPKPRAGTTPMNLEVLGFQGFWLCSVRIATESKRKGWGNDTGGAAGTSLPEIAAGLHRLSGGAGLFRGHHRRGPEQRLFPLEVGTVTGFLGAAGTGGF